MGKVVRYITCFFQASEKVDSTYCRALLAFPRHKKKVRRISPHFEKWREGGGMHKSGRNGKGGSKVQPET